MARTKGYRSYRGRGTRKKILLAVLLCLVILAAAAVIVLQEYVVYDADGTPHLSIPWQREEETPPQEEVDLVIQEPEAPPATRALLLAQTPLTQADWETARTALRDGGWNACAVTLKDGGGAVYFDSRTALPDAVETAQYIARQRAIIKKYSSAPVGTDMMPTFTAMSYAKVAQNTDVMQFNEYAFNRYAEIYPWFNYVYNSKKQPFWQTETSCCWNGSATSNYMRPHGFVAMNGWSA